MLDSLRNEIIEAQKGRLDLLTWKVILVAGLGGIGLGFNIGSDSQAIVSPHLVLGLILLVCLYVDALCRHLQLRILVISDFLEYCDENQLPASMKSFVMRRG